MTLFIMTYNLNSVAYNVYNDGSAEDLSTGEKCKDFATEFLAMCELGWKSALEIREPETEIDIITPKKRNNYKREFRHDWYAYEDRILEELSI